MRNHILVDKKVLHAKRVGKSNDKHCKFQEAIRITEENSTLQEYGNNHYRYRQRDSQINRIKPATIFKLAESS